MDFQLLVYLLRVQTFEETQANPGFIIILTLDLLTLNLHFLQESELKC